MRLKNNVSVIVLSWSVLILIVLISALMYLYKISDTVRDFAISNAKTQLQYEANDAVLNIFTHNDMLYSDIAHITKNKNSEITGIEIDAKNANIIKSKILLEIDKRIPKKEIYTVGIPLGTIMFNNVIGGLGPEVAFKSQISSGCNIDFNSSFESVGVNQTRHKIILDVTLSGVILILGKQNDYSVKTTFIVAETIISGHIPQSYANFQNSDNKQ